MRRSLRSCVPLLAALALACGGSGSSRPPVASVSLTAAQTGPLTSLGDTLQLTATALDGQGRPIPGVPIVFSSSAAAAASVAQTGLVTAVANGTATIRASAEGKEATLDVTVAQVVAQVLVTPASILVPQGETPLFRASAVDARGHAVAGAPAPVWSTTSPAVATIAADGRATVTPTATNGDTVSAVAAVGAVSSTTGGLMTVDSTAIYVETIVVRASGSTSFSSLGLTVQLSATASNPRQGDVTAQVTFTWSSSSPAVASVSASGVVTAAGNGTASISATSNGVSGALGVTVAQIVATVSVATESGAPASSLASFGETLQLAATAHDSGGSAVAGATFTWQSDATAVATVNGSGLVTAAGNGSAHVIAKATSNQVSNPAPGFTVTVQQRVAIVSVLPATASIPRCMTVQYSAVPRDARGNPVAGAPAATWTSSNTTFASIDPNGGLARGVAVGGPVTITATSAGVPGTAQLTVNSSPIVVNWNLGATTVPANVTICSGQSVVWRNTDVGQVHTATGNTPPPSTGSIQPGADSSPQIFSAGTYAYHCLFHPGMTGTVTVTP